MLNATIERTGVDRRSAEECLAEAAATARLTLAALDRLEQAVERKLNLPEREQFAAHRSPPTATTPLGIQADDLRLSVDEIRDRMLTLLARTR